MQNIDAAKKNRQPSVPSHQPKHDLARGANDLTGQPDKCIHEGLNSMCSTASLSLAYFSPYRPDSGSSKANQAFMVQASEAMTMYAQLLV